MPELTQPPDATDQPTARTLNDLLKIRADNLDKIHHRFGAIGSAVGYKIDKIEVTPQPTPPRTHHPDFRAQEVGS